MPHELTLVMVMVMMMMIVSVEQRPGWTEHCFNMYCSKPIKQLNFTDCCGPFSELE
jgi:hypothetical protein